MQNPWPAMLGVYLFTVKIMECKLEIRPPLRRGQRLPSGCAQSMKLANKYELFDALTTGQVETFVARDLASGERVLVHVFESGPSPSDPPATEWALASFCVLAPTPPGAVIDVGRYAGTTFAYLVTKVPDADALQKWVLAYESYAQKTQEIPVTPEVDATSSSAAESGTRPPVQSDAETAAFFPPPKASDSTVSSPRPKDTKTVPAPVAQADRLPTRPKESFTGMFQAAAAPAECEKGGRSTEAKPGDFTSFFQGPFTGQASETPNLTPHPPEKDSRAGEFTQIFGAGRGHSQETPVERSPSNAPLNEPGGFTQLFSSPAPVQTSPRYEPPTFPKEEKPVKTEDTIVFDKPAWEPQIPAAPPIPAKQKNPFESLPAVIPPLPSGGPSEYTMIVSGGMRPPTSPDEPLIAGGTNPPGAKSADAFAMPKAPMFPPVPVPKMPAAPQMPKFPAPQMPGLAAPKAPQAPDVPKPPVSYWPLILTLTVLLFVAVLLVLYFALKH